MVVNGRQQIGQIDGALKQLLSVLAYSAVLDNATCCYIIFCGQNVLILKSLKNNSIVWAFNFNHKGHRGYTK
jgi:hypothetical protein